MSPLWKVVSVVTLVAVILTAAVVVLSNNPVASAMPALAAQADKSTGITLTAQGKVKAKPDVAYVSLGVRTTAPTAREAMSANSAVMNALVARLEALGIAKKDMQTGSLSLYPQTKPIKPEELGTDQIVGYWANNSLNVTINDLNRAGEVLDAAVTAGANTVGGLRFGVKDDAKLRDEALREAVKAARAKADLIATGLGLKVTGVLSVSEEGYSGPGPVYEMAPAMAKGGDGSVPVEAGELTFTASVRATFSF